MAALAAAVGYVSLVQTVAYSKRSGNPSRAHELAANDGRITALEAARLSGLDATSADRRRADALSRAALARDPTAVTAVSTLGLNTQIRGDVTGARRLFVYAQRLSRRDLQTQLWAIEDAVARGNVNLALQHYDIALRTSRTASEILFPVLNLAAADPAIRTALIRRLTARPAWGDGFIGYVAGHNADPRATAALMGGLRKAGYPVPPGAMAPIVNGLIAGNFLREAWEYYIAIHPGADPRRSRDSRFTARNDYPTPFDWVTVNEAGITASVQAGNHGGIFDFAAPSGIGGDVLRQVQLLPAGRYRLEGHSIGIDLPDDALPYWTLTCGDGRELGRVQVPVSQRDGGRFGGWFDVPSGCQMQTLTLIARPSDAIAGAAGQIDRVELKAVR